MFTGDLDLFGLPDSPLQQLNLQRRRPGPVTLKDAKRKIRRERSWPFAGRICRIVT